MHSLLITPASEAEFSLLVALLEKMNVTARVLSADEQEDAGLALLLQDAENSPAVSREAVMQALGRA